MLKLFQTFFFEQEMVILGKINGFILQLFKSTYGMFFLTAEVGVGQEERVGGNLHCEYKTVMCIY